MDNPQIGDRVECLSSTLYVKEKATGSVTVLGVTSCLVKWDDESMLNRHSDDRSWWISNDNIALIKRSFLKRILNSFKKNNGRIQQ